MKNIMAAFGFFMMLGLAGTADYEMATGIYSSNFEYLLKCMIALLLLLPKVMEEKK